MAVAVAVVIRLLSRLVHNRRLGGVKYKPCARCSIPALDPDTGVATREPMRTLAQFRTRDHEVFFGLQLRQRLDCHYCGKRSKLTPGHVRKFRCPHCLALNFFDEVCAMLSPSLRPLSLSSSHRTTL